MRIRTVEGFNLSCPLAQPFGWSQGWVNERNVGIVRITTDEGLVGWGEGSADVEHLAPLLIGADPMDRNGLWERCFHSMYNANNFVGFGGSALSAIDIALWDLAGKATGLPVCDLLGGRIRDRVAVYATGLYYTEGEFPERLLEEARSYVDAGYTGMKTKVGGLSIEEDVRRVAAIRETIGFEVQLMVDANLAYNATTAIRIGRQLAELDVFWFEEPVNPRDIDGLLQVKAALPMAIAGGENLRTRFDFRDYLTRRAFDVVQPDVAHCGGLTEMSRIAAMASACGTLVCPHVWGTPIMIAASLHLAATLPSCPPARNPVPYAQEPVMEFDRTPNAIREELCTTTFVAQDSYLDVPTGPGLGIEVDEESLQHFCRRV
ncbi:MAG: mandelate racemase/muconate lactonizing enzyme family protein [bacterium]|nr:mandelate racemase/muconate lactonizing enzyme family protein [bacterium]